MDSIDLVLTLFTIAPLLVLGSWHIAIESFSGAFPESSKISSTTRMRSRHSFFERFAIWASLALIISVLLILLWSQLKVPICLAALTALCFSLYQRNSDKRFEKMKNSQIELELPQVIQTVCLLVSAGISPTKSLEVLSRESNSQVAREFRKVINDVKHGTSAISAMDKLLVKATTSGMRRFITSLIVATERGAPLVPILVSLVRDSQAEWRTELLKRAGKAEIGLMIPVVFLLLPLSVLFALFPSIRELQSF